MQDKLGVLIVALALCLLGQTAQAQQKIVHPHDLEFEKLLEGDDNAIARHWNLTQRLGSEQAGKWEYDIAVTCASVVKCYTKKLRMPSWVENTPLRTAEAHRPDFNVTENFDELAAIRERVGALFALLYTLEHAEHFNKVGNDKRNKAATTLIIRIFDETKPMEDDEENESLDDLEKMAWAEQFSRTTTADSGEKIGADTRYAVAYFNRLIEGREYRKAAIIACRYNLDAAAVTAATDMLITKDADGSSPRLIPARPGGRMSWVQWRAEVLDRFSMRKVCGKDLWHDTSPL